MPPTTRATKFNAGQEIDAQCPKCELLLAHTVLAAVNGVPARIMCNTCKREGKWRASMSPGTKVAGAAPKRTTTDADGTVRVTSKRSPPEDPAVGWANQMRLAANTGRATKSYDMKGAFEIGEVIAHARFGDGVVRDAPAADRIVVVFKEGAKVLAHRRA